MTVSSEAAMIAAIDAKWAAADPTGYGALSASDRTAIKGGLITAVAKQIREELLTNMTVSVSTTGTTIQACSAGGAAGTCSSSGSGTVT